MTGRYVQRMRPRRLLVTLGVLLALVASGCGGGTTKTLSDELAAAPYDLLDGGQSSLGTHAGRPLLVNFFASWCAPCVAEMPALEEVHQQYRGRVDFLGLDTQEQAADGRKLVEKTGITYPVGLDPDGTWFTAFGGLGMPTTVLIRPNGSIAAVHSGALTADALRSMIDKAFF